LAALLIALYPPHFLGTYYLMNEVLFAFLLALAAVLSLRFLESPTGINMLLLGVISGLSALVRAEGSLLVLPALAALTFSRGIRLERIITLGLTGLCTVVLVLAPWWTRNYSIYGTLIAFSTSNANPRLAAAYWPELLPEHATVWPTSSSSDEIRLNEQWAAEAKEINQRQLSEDPVGFARKRAQMLTIAALRPATLPWLDGSPMSWWQVWFNRAVRVAHPVVLLAAVLAIARHWRKPAVFLLASILVLRLSLYAAVLPMPRYSAPSFVLITVLAAVLAADFTSLRRATN
jgi:hypothetical protein